MKNGKVKKSPYSRKIKIDKSRIHGLGIIARRDIRRGEVIFVIKGEMKSWQVNNKKEALYGAHWIGVGKNKWIDPVGFGRYINHSSSPNSGIVGRVVVKAMKDIKKGKEITMDYSTTEDQLLWHLKDFVSGESVRSIQFLPQEKFKKYLPYIPRYFQKIYKNYHNLNVHG